MLAPTHLDGFVHIQGEQARQHFEGSCFSECLFSDRLMAVNAQLQMTCCRDASLRRQLLLR